MTTHTPPAGMEILTREWREKNAVPKGAVYLNSLQQWKPFAQDDPMIVWRYPDWLFAAPLGTMKAVELEPSNWDECQCCRRPYGLHIGESGLCHAGGSAVFTPFAEPDDLALVLSRTHNDVRLSDLSYNGLDYRCSLKPFESLRFIEGRGTTPEAAIQSALAAWRAGK